MRGRERRREKEGEEDPSRDGKISVAREGSRGKAYVRRKKREREEEEGEEGKERDRKEKRLGEREGEKKDERKRDCGERKLGEQGVSKRKRTEFFNSVNHAQVRQA